MNVVVHAGALLPVLLYATLDLAARPFSPGSDHQQARVLPCKHTQQPSATRPPNGKRKKAPLGRTATARCHHAVVPNRPRKRLRIHLLHNTQPKGQHQRSMLVCVCSTGGSAHQWHVDVIILAVAECAHGPEAPGEERIVFRHEQAVRVARVDVASTGEVRRHRVTLDRLDRVAVLPWRRAGS